MAGRESSRSEIVQPVGAEYYKDLAQSTEKAAAELK